MNDKNILDVDNLVNLSFETNIGNLNHIFHSLVIDLGRYLDLEPVTRNVRFIYKDDGNSNIKKTKNIPNLGIKKYCKNNTLLIEIYKKYRKFLPIILLREAYKCFIPEKLINNNIVEIVINQIVLKDLYKLDQINE